MILKEPVSKKGHLLKKEEGLTGSGAGPGGGTVEQLLCDKGSNREGFMKEVAFD